MSLKEISQSTEQEAAAYYQPGRIYLNAADNREYVYLVPDAEATGMAHFMSYDGHNLFIPCYALGTFLPDVASDGMELTRVDD